MIKSRKEYRDYQAVEFKWGGVKEFLFPSPSIAFIKALRKLEYHYNTPGIWHKIMVFFAWRRWSRISYRSGISIPKNVCGKGLTIPHHGSIVVNAACRIGDNCMIQNNVNIGANGGSLKAPRIGRDVYIGPGAVIFGDIEIADGCYIGANAVVNKTVVEPNSVIVGVPGVVKKTDPIHWWHKNGLIRE